MYWLENRQVIPLFIGKSEKYGKQGTNLSINIKNIANNKAFFCRWGDNYAYHIGGLSAVVCPDHPMSKINLNYKKWATTLFESYPTCYPKLRQATYFWIHAWERGPTSLTYLKYHLISVASTLFPDLLLNQESVNRR